ncbi:MAG: membrane protein insertase YidC [Muribaculaceae bacterium]|nr:membrane protein insertase YidC [Muribaculaceae bacterium]
MDKNTLVGILLMGAVIFGFMYLNTPSQEQLEAQRQEQLKQEADEQARRDAEAAEALRIQPVTEADLTTLRSALRLYGTHTTEGVRSFSSKAVDLKLINDSTIAGTVTTPSGTIDVNNVITGNYQDSELRHAPAASRALHNAITNLTRYKNFATHLNGEEQIVQLQNDVLSLNLSTKGGQISDVRLTDYFCYLGGDTTQVCLWNQNTNNYSFTLRSDSQKFETSDFFFTPVVESDSSVLMRLDLGAGSWWGIRYTMPEAGGYVVRMDVVQHGMAAADIIPMQVSTMEFNWHQIMMRNEEGRMFEERNSAIYYKESGNDVEELNAMSDAKKTVSEPIKWIAFKNQFFSSVLIADNYFNAGSKLTQTDLKDHNPSMLKDMTAIAQVNYSTTRDSVASFNFYLGPNLYPVLSDMDRISPDEELDLTRLIPLGWSLFRWINTLIVIPVFTFLGKYITSYGLIILLLTIFIKCLLFPFTYKSFKSQAKMRVLSPEIKEINEKYPGKDNAMIRQQKTMELYSRAGANPMSGCLPLLLQMPILIAMFSFFPSCIELRGQSFLWAHDLSAPDAILSWDANIPIISWAFGNHISLFCLLMTATNIVYSHINMQNQPGGNSMPGMKFMTYAMPLIFLFWFNNYASGLSYYYFLSLLITIIQTWVIRKWVVDDTKVRAEMLANAKKPRKKSGFMARLEEAQRQQQAMMRQQQQQKGKKK